ncbi:mitochondrial import inner membrane translocase subunit Tim10 B [Spea bombifrons]|uniref:mitochondrial import inner membrane translocase subunit Tim10 B n=1 Tax=Spea bombifrons TaxID=233779 RepID=UPI0023493FD5|nr:mitochondrial import inner membrane translocase subunit Tim10 B [Spea bombifrons]
MEADQLRNLRDFLLVYNKMTEICFTRCARNLNYRVMTMDEERCLDNCASKLIRSNHRLMAAYVGLMPSVVQRRMAELENQSKEVAPSGPQEALLPPSDTSSPGATQVAAPPVDLAAKLNPDSLSAEAVTPNLWTVTPDHGGTPSVDSDP